MITRTRLLAAAVAACYATAPAWAQVPTNPVVKSGSASFSQAGNVLTVTNSNGAIIHWDSFSIGTGYATYFAQPSASSAVLNRVVAANPSQIYGTLSSNGKVWLINPNGIFIGPGGMINTAGFVASTLGVSNANFLAGKLTFDNTPGAGAVVNRGAITTPSGGSVYLVGANVSNEGIIVTPKGETLLAAGETVDLIDTGTPGVKVEITGAAGNATNLGQIVAAAGRIGMAGVLVRNSGTLNASSVVNEGGRIFLKATQDTYVEGNGSIAATGSTGGQVEVLGNRVAVTDNASIDASGTNGGGSILVGGDYQGKNPDVQNAAVTYFGANATLKADATDNGNGGKVVVWADDTTRAYGSISARGGANGGNGGFVETSGHRYLDANNIQEVDTRAPMGNTGTWLLDPTNIVIDASSTPIGSFSGGYFSNGSNLMTDNIGWATINSQLGTSNVVIQTGALNGYGAGDITVSASNSFNSSHSLSLVAENDVVFNSGVAVSNSGGGNISLVAGWNSGGSPATAPTLTNGTGTITFQTGSLLSTTGGLSLKAGSDVTLQAGANLGASGNLGVQSGGNIAIDGTIQGSGGSYLTMDFVAGGSIAIGSGATVLANNSQISMSAQGISIGPNAKVSTGGFAAGYDVADNTNPHSLVFVANSGGAGDFTMAPGSKLITSQDLSVTADNIRIGESSGPGATIERLVTAGPSTVGRANLAATTGNITINPASGIIESGNKYGFNASLAAAGDVTLGAPYGYGGSILTTGSVTLVGGWDGNANWVNNSAYAPNISGGVAGSVNLYGPVMAGGSLTVLANADITLASATSGGNPYTVNHVRAGAVSADCAVGGGNNLCFSNTYYGTFGALNGGLKLLAQGNIDIESDVGSGGNAMIVAGWNNYASGTASPTAAAYNRDLTYGNPQISLRDGTLFSPGSGNVTLLAPGQIAIDASNRQAGIDMNRGTLTVTANALSMTAGNDGGGMMPTARIVSNGDQYFTLGDSSNPGSLILHGSDWGYGGSARIERDQYLDGGVARHSNGGQNFTIYGGGSVALTSGSGSTGSIPTGQWSGDCAGGGCSSNDASIEDHGSGNVAGVAYGGGQTFDFVGGGSLTLTGGAAGADNRANIDSDGPQKMWSSGGSAFDIFIYGGTGGSKVTSSGADYYLTNDAGISSNTSQDIDTSGGALVMTGGGDNGTYGGAFLGAPTQQLRFGNVTLTGGYSDVRDADGLGAPVAIGNKNGADIHLTVGGDLSITGGDGGGSQVLIGSLTGTAAVVIDTSGNVSIDSGYGGVGIGSRFGTSMTGSIADLAGNVYIATGAGITSGARMEVSATNNVAVDGSLTSTGDSSDDGVFITAGESGGAGGNIYLGADSSITGKAVWLGSYSGLDPNDNTINGDIVQDAGGTITISGTGNPVADGWFRAEGDMALNGSVSLTHAAGGSVYGFAGYGASGKMLRVANISALHGGSIDLESSGDAAIGTIYAPTGTVSIVAGGAIYDDNGSALNVTADNINLTSQNGGIAGQLAISLDTLAAMSLTAYVGYGAANGGISLRNLGAAPGVISLADDSHDGNVSFFNTGSMTLGTGATSGEIFAANGDVFIASGGNLAYTDSYIFASDSVLLSAIGDLDYRYSNAGNSCSPLNSLGLVAGGALTIASGATALGTSVKLAASTLNLYGAVTASSGDVGFVAGNLNASGGSITSASGRVVGEIASNATLDNGAYIKAGTDVYLEFGSSTSLLSLSNASYIWAQSPSTIHLAFDNRAAGGMSIDASSGLFDGVGKSPATAGAGLDLAYYGTASAPENPVSSTTDPCVINPSSCATTATTQQQQEVVPVPPPSSTGSGGTATSSGTRGGGDNEFGGSNTSSSGASASESSNDSGDDKDKKAGASSSGNGSDDHKSDKKPMGRCNA
ncbi:MAG: filamentous hemagglutinin N-terminal domain-containing protein [Rhodocyclaceae bacterium]|nr:filamentous hemagglutinin N-terminal domain-containing protein [Rhodocyclaceae bacterium]